MDGAFIFCLCAFIINAWDIVMIGSLSNLMGSCHDPIQSRVWQRLSLSQSKLRYSALYVGDLNLQAFLCVPGLSCLMTRL